MISVCDATGLEGYFVDTSVYKIKTNRNRYFISNIVYPKWVVPDRESVITEKILFYKSLITYVGNSSEDPSCPKMENNDRHSAEG